MKSLDINTASTNLGAYNSRQFLIEFTGGNFTERLQGATTHTVIVPYSSLSRKIQTIQRLGGKIINVSIRHKQPETFKGNSENAALENVALENAAPEAISDLILEADHGTPSNKSVEQSIPQTLEGEVVEVAEIASGTFPEITLQPIVEPAHKEVSVLNSENISAAAQVVTPKKKKSTSESMTSPKKTRVSTKASQGISKQDSSLKVQEPIAIAETITVSEQILEPVPEIAVEPISAIIPETSLNSISEEVSSTLPQNEAQEPIAPLAKAKTTRNSSKSGHGFNKSTSGAKSPRSPKQPKS